MTPPARFNINFRTKTEEEKYLKLSTKILQIDMMPDFKVKETYEKVYKFLSEIMNFEDLS